jgi:uncharacterized protein YjiS (DUF1127 family)
LGLFPKNGSWRADALSSACAEDRRRRRRRSRDFAGSTLAAIAAIVGGVRGWQQRRRDLCRLAVMSERELQDIGICRADIADEIGKPFWRK